MEDRAVIVKIDKNRIKAARIIYDECRTCKKHCIKRVKSFSVLNKKKLEIKEGSTITFERFGTKEAVGGIVAFLFPIASMFASCLLFPKIATLKNIPTEDWQTALFSVGMFIFVSVLIIVFSRFSFLFLRPEIKQVL